MNREELQRMAKSQQVLNQRFAQARTFFQKELGAEGPWDLLVKYVVVSYHRRLLKERGGGEQASSSGGGVLVFTALCFVVVGFAIGRATAS